MTTSSAVGGVCFLRRREGSDVVLVPCARRLWVDGNSLSVRVDLEGCVESTVGIKFDIEGIERAVAADGIVD